MLMELTPAQWSDIGRCREDALVEYLRDKSGSVGDLAAAAAACYAAIGKSAPVVVVAPGPIVALAWAAMLRGQLDDQLHGQLRGQLHGQLYGQLRGQLYGQLDGQLGGQLYGQLDGRLDSLLDSQLNSQLGDQLRGCLWGAWQFSWLTHWLHVNQLDGINPVSAETRALAEAWRTLSSVGPFTVPLDGVLIAIQGRTALHRDNQNRLHCTDGPAWAWADGTEVWALDGIRVPSWVVMEPTFERIMSDELPNSEQRRVAMAHYGWDRWAAEVGDSMLVDAHPDSKMGSLYDLPDSISDGAARLLVCDNASPNRDGSTRRYGLLCSAAASTVIEAQASLAQLSVDEFLMLDGAS